MLTTNPLETTPRKRPTQARAKARVLAILDATRGLLRESGYEKLTTNRVAAAAGIPVGSVYQYFPNKDALVVALIEEHTEAMLGLFAEILTVVGEAPLPQAVATYVEAVLRFHADDPALHHVRFAQAPRLSGERPDLNQQMRSVICAFLESRRAELEPSLDLEVATLLLVTSVEAVTQRAVREPHTDLALLAHELTRMICRYLNLENT